MAIAAHATLASPVADLDVDWIASAAARIGDEDLLLEAAGVVFAFNFINRIADAPGAAGIPLPSRVEADSGLGRASDGVADRSGL